jgi:hypothetical protein
MGLERHDGWRDLMLRPLKTDLLPGKPVHGSHRAARDAKPGGPYQWLEEALVEAFSFRGLGRLADSWRPRPPFPNDNAYADAILEYRDRPLLAGQAGHSEKAIAARAGKCCAQELRMAQIGQTADGPQFADPLARSTRNRPRQKDKRPLSIGMGRLDQRELVLPKLLRTMSSPDDSGA